MGNRLHKSNLFITEAFNLFLFYPAQFFIFDVRLNLNKP